VKILVVGDWHSEVHEEAVYKAFIALGHETFRFSWYQYFIPVGSGFASKLPGLVAKVQNKLIAGPLVARLNADFVETALHIRPNAIFVYRGTHITGESLRKVKESLPATVLVGYNNDDPLAEGHFRLLWRHFLAAIPRYDLMLAYRLHNIGDFRRAGAQHVELLRSWFVPERNRPVDLTPEERKRFGCDVVFVGHYEADGRVEILEAIAAAGYKMRLFGPGYDWDPVLKKSKILHSLLPIKLVWGDEYNKALCGAKIALCFLSKLNRDTYTRRCFEIPATGTFLMSEYTEDLTSLYEEDTEAVFFKSKGELIEKLRRYLVDDGLREMVAKAGYERVLRDQHDVVSRMRQVVTLIAEFHDRSNIENEHNALFDRIYY
jgi:spore maturation protein CgeB